MPGQLESVSLSRHSLLHKLVLLSWALLVLRVVVMVLQVLLEPKVVVMAPPVHLGLRLVGAVLPGFPGPGLVGVALLVLLIRALGFLAEAHVSGICLFFLFFFDFSTWITTISFLSVARYRGWGV